MSSEAIALCNARDLVDGGEAVPFDVVYGGQSCRAFAVRWRGQVHAYLNRCAHVAMEMDWRPNRFFDDSGQWPLPRRAGEDRHHGRSRRGALAY